MDARGCSTTLHGHHESLEGLPPTSLAYKFTNWKGKLIRLVDEETDREHEKQMKSRPSPAGMGMTQSRRERRNLPVNDVDSKEIASNQRYHDISLLLHILALLPSR